MMKHLIRSPHLDTSVAECSARMGIPGDVVVEIAVNRLHRQHIRHVEGDLASIDFSQSLPLDPLAFDLADWTP